MFIQLTPCIIPEYRHPYIIGLRSLVGKIIAAVFHRQIPVFICQRLGNIHKAPSFFICQLFQFLIILPDDIILQHADPVSYTHLDVYKRQAADDEQHEAQAHAKGLDMHSSEEHTSDKQGNGRSYVSLDLKKAKEKADALFNDVSEKVEDTVQKIKSSEEYETLSSKVDEAVTKIKNSEEFENVTTKINDTVERIKNSNEYANVDEQMESALNKVKEATEKEMCIRDSQFTRSSDFQQ